MAGLADVAYWRLKMQQLEKEWQAEIAELRNALLETDSLRQQAEARAVAAEAEVADATLKLKRTERKVALLTVERDGLKAIVESYDHEGAPVSSQQQQQQQPGSPNTPQKKMRDMRIKELEAALADSQLHVTQLEDALARSSHASNSSLSKAETEDLNEVYEKLKCLERECDRLRQEAAILESKLGHGDFDSSKTKVLHLIKNLEAEFHIDEHHEALQAEVNALRERVKLLEQNGEITGNGRVSDSGFLEERNIFEKKVVELTKQVSTLEKRETRYQRVFADKINLFRTACFLLFGYTVLMREEKDPSTGMPVTLFTLQSIYAQNADEELLFQLNSGRMDMVANEYTTSPELERQVTTFLKNFKSYPAFIANLTMELFNKSTLG
ncbi:hypothetical protein BDL97_02G074300 [Sphagnum fallax]|nr:hypothetical protein BDL97_02G074300 [Sphagnum fallax]